MHSVRPNLWYKNFSLCTPFAYLVISIIILICDDNSFCAFNFANEIKNFNPFNFLDVYSCLYHRYCSSFVQEKVMKLYPFRFFS